MPLSTPDPTRHSPVPIERLPDASNYMLLIVQSPDPLMWYASKIGQTVPLVGQWPEGFKSREPAGYINIVKYADARIVKMIPHEAADPQWEEFKNRQMIREAFEKDCE